ncbi:MAG: hypothetical protein ACOCXA_07470, partial [Planctomycetota bacterium]
MIENLDANIGLHLHVHDGWLSGREPVPRSRLTGVTPMRSHALAVDHPAPFVWYDEQGRGRNRYALLRRVFDLDSEVDEATLHCFADARYHLWINGHFLGMGPVRFYPEFPCYDSHNLGPWLRPGRNVIAARVWQPGVPDYQRVHHAAGWCAWGQVIAGPQPIDLGTGEGWRCIRDARVDAGTPVFSFAIGPIETVDERQGPGDWQQPAYDDEAWPAAVKLADQQAWGSLRQRPIPALSDEPLNPTRVVASRSVLDDELHLSATVAVDAGGCGDEAGQQGLVLTWLHSARDQELTVARWWGDWWV